MREGSDDYVTRGRRATCACCGKATIVRGRQVWKSRNVEASLRIVSAERDGAIVEQVGREGRGRWGLNYRELLRDYRLEVGGGS